MAKRYVPSSSDFLEEECLDLANKLITRCSLPIARICSIHEINSQLIALLFESITDSSVPDAAPFADNSNGAHNVQAVIDALSLDILGISLSHITGEDVVNGDVGAISNLLEVFDGIVQFISPESSRSSLDQRQKLQRKLGRRNLLSRSGKRESTRREADQNPPYNADFQPVDATQSPVSGEDSVPTPKQVENGKLKPEFARVGFRASQDDKKNEPGAQNPEQAPAYEMSQPSTSAQPSSEMTEPSTAANAAMFKDSAAKKSSRSQPAGVPKAELRELYGKNLESRVKKYMEEKFSLERAASRLEKAYETALKTPQLRKTVPCKKSFLLPHNLRPRTASTTSPKRVQSEPGLFKHKAVIRKQSGTQSSAQQAAFIQGLKEDFPGINLSPHTVRVMTRKYDSHLKREHKKVKNALSRKTRTQIQLEEATKRQAILSNILKKEIHQNQNLRYVREEKRNERAIDYSLRDARLQSAKLKRYFDDYHVKMGQQMQKRNYTEEQLVKKAHEDGLRVENEQVAALCALSKEADTSDGARHKIYLEALENFYETQFSALAESLAIEKRDMHERAKAQKRVLRMMKKEFQENMEREVQDFQEQVLSGLQDTHFRELDAENRLKRLREKYAVRPR